MSAFRMTLRWRVPRFLDGGGRVDLGLGGCGDDHDPAERLDDLIGPPPVPWQAEVSASAAAGEAGGYVQHLEPERLGLGGGEVTVEGEQPQPGGQIGSHGDYLQPGLIDGVLPVMGTGPSRCLWRP